MKVKFGDMIVNQQRNKVFGHFKDDFEVSYGDEFYMLLRQNPRFFDRQIDDIITFDVTRATFRPVIYTETVRIFEVSFGSRISFDEAHRCLNYQLPDDEFYFNHDFMTEKEFIVNRQEIEMHRAYDLRQKEIERMAEMSKILHRR
jgi:hypothetical protein